MLYQRLSDNPINLVKWTLCYNVSWENSKWFVIYVISHTYSFFIRGNFRIHFYFVLLMVLFRCLFVCLFIFLIRRFYTNTFREKKNEKKKKKPIFLIWLRISVQSFCFVDMMFQVRLNDFFSVNMHYLCWALNVTNHVLFWFALSSKICIQNAKSKTKLRLNILKSFMK